MTHLTILPLHHSLDNNGHFRNLRIQIMQLPTKSPKQDKPKPPPFSIHTNKTAL